MDVIIGFIIGMLAEFFGGLGAEIAAQKLRGLSRRSRGLEQPDESLLLYLDAFCRTARAPKWDPNIFAMERIQQAQVRLVERVVDAELEKAEEIGVDISPRKVHSLSIPNLLHWILFEAAVGVSKKPKHPRYTNVFVILGQPASGKSILVLQLAQLLGNQAKSDQGMPIPVYVNLTHFDNRYPLNTSGLEQLIHRSIKNGCPRYLPADDSSESIISSTDMVDSVVRPKPDTRLLFVLDGIDEMPVVDDLAAEQNRRIAALANFIQRNPRHLFLVTCRIRDYLQLRDYSSNFQMAKLEVLPWNRGMFLRYLEARKKEKEGDVLQIRDTVLRAYGSDLWGQFRDSPLLGALLFGGAGLKPAKTISDAWANFLETFLHPHFATDREYRASLELLEKLALAKTLKPAKAFSLKPALMAKAVASGLLVPGHPSPEFVIKPLQQYFAARYIWRHIGSGGTSMDELEITHSKLRVVFVMMSEIADQIDAFTAYLVRRLRMAGQPYLHAERFELFASCLTADKLKCDPELQNTLVDALELVIELGNSGDFDICMRGIEQLPEVLLLNPIRSLDFMLGVLMAGTRESKRRLLQLMVCKPVIALKFRRVVVSLAYHFVNKAQFGAEFCLLMERIGERVFGKGLRAWAVAMLARGTRFVADICYVYGIYFLGLWAAHYAIGGTAWLFALEWNNPATAPFLPSSPTEWMARLAFLAMATGIPWFIITRMAKAEIRFKSLAARVGSLFTTSFFVRYVFLIPFLGIAVLNTISSTLEFGIVACLLLVPFLVVIATISSLRSRSSGTFREANGDMPRASAEQHGLGGGPLPHPPSEPVPYYPRRGFGTLFSLIGFLFRNEIATAWKKRKLQGLVIVSVVLASAIALLAVYHLEMFALMLAGLALLSLLLKRYLMDPYRAYRSIGGRLREQSLSRLNANFEREVNSIFGQITNSRLWLIFRKKYVFILENYIRWDKQLLTRFERLAARRDLPHELASYMEAVISRKRKEIQLDTNPACNPEMLQALYK